jgi:biotin operon repressor
MSNRDIAYNVLRDHANEWVSGNTLVAAGAGYRFSARIYELRKAGHVIEERKSTGRSAVHEYRLVVADVAPGQVALWDAA